MRATPVLILLATAWVSEAGAQPPPPPYAADPQFNAGGQAAQPLPLRSAQGLDRYSGGADHAVAPPTPQRYAFSAPQNVAPSQAPARTLGWSGKVEAQQQVAPPAQGGWTQMTEHWGSAPAAGQPAAYPSYRAPSVQPAANQGWRPLYPGAAPATQAPPRTIYDPPSASQPQAQLQAPPAPQQAVPQRTAQAQAPSGPHFYSLHREYGIEPDPIPIPPKFFGPTADLSAPPPDPVLKRVTGSDGQTHTQAVPTDDQGG